MLHDSVDEEQLADLYRRRKVVDTAIELNMQLQVVKLQADKWRKLHAGATRAMLWMGAYSVAATGTAIALAILLMQKGGAS